MFSRLRRPSPALVVALLALFVSLAGTAVAAGVVPLAKRALVADNAKKLGGKTRAQVAATPGPATTLGGKTADEIAATPGPATSLDGKSADQIAATPGPASTAAGLVSIKSAAWALAGNEGKDFSVACDAGQKAIAGGFDNPSGAALALDTRPSSDGGSWVIFLGNLSASAGASGTIYAVCLK
jgi:hypothetical protein